MVGSNVKYDMKGVLPRRPALILWTRDHSMDILFASQEDVETNRRIIWDAQRACSYFSGTNLITFLAPVV